MSAEDAVAEQHMEVAARAAEEARLGISPHASTDRFIPLSINDLIQRLTLPEVWPTVDVQQVRTFFKFLVHWRHLSYSDGQRELALLYAPFSPDSDIKYSGHLSSAEKAEYQQAFVTLMRKLLVRANYEEIPRERIEKIISEHNPYGLALEVDLSEFDELHVYYRGLSETVIQPGKLEKYALLKKPVTLSIYQRLFVLLKMKPIEVRVREVMLKDDVDAAKAEKVVAKLRKSLPPSISGDYIYLKLFKFIPRADLEMLFPNTRVKMRGIDKLKLGVTAGGGGAAGIATTIAKLSTVAALTNPVTVGMALAGLGAVVFRQVSSIFATRTNYMAQLSKNLYFNSLANNRSVMSVISERGEEEDIKEELLLYTLLARSSIKHSEIGDAKLAIEHYLQSEFNVRVNFDVEEALGRLLQSGIVQQAADGTLLALQPTQGKQHIDRMWDGYLDTIASRDGVHLGGGDGS